MYKVFVNDKPIILTDSLKNEKGFPLYFFKEVIIDEVIYKLNSNTIKGVYLYVPNLLNGWNKLRNSFIVIQAAGGLVLNDKNEFLFIYRGNKWDLPKGRIEKGEEIEETAVREVEEECGITGLEIKIPLIVTYHLFYYKGETRLKETFWYLMHSNYSGKLTPQLEEGITDAAFKDTVSTENAMKNTYANIKLVFESYEKKRKL